ncbi:N-6 DNA methylase [Sphingomonas phyllosphaerae]|uniref:N-6 DNA methylase n=1 Tax=Sphingomonas phyllosphaerae TaxID=257003 RepID=UPI0003B336E9|nr:N-6 DNA methylase [Sphingomonas phyllosphaerae]
MARSFGQFYTPPTVAQALVGMVEGAPASAIDLGCGRGALSRAAVDRWGATLRLTTVDIDPAAGPALGLWADEHRHFRRDLLHNDAFAADIVPGSFDLAVLNPPYGRMLAIGGAGTDADVGARGPSPALEMRQRIRCRATIFTLHALRAVRAGGVVAAILPETLVTSRLAGRNRALITAEASLRSIATLPERTFPGTEARTVMVVLNRLEEARRSADPWFTRAAAPGLDDPALAPLQDLEVEIVRGSLSTPDARRERAFHLDGFAAARNGVVQLGTDHVTTDDRRTARPGDILIARVGRSIPDKIARVETGTGAISDCVYRLRCSPLHTDRVWRGLRSRSGRTQIEAGLSGLTTRVLPLSALLALRV